MDEARGRADIGQVLPLVALQLWVIAGVVVVVMMVGERAVERSRAQAGADAVALAVADGGSADAVARVNGVVLESVRPGPPVDVVVSRRGVQAAARAQGGRAQWSGLDPRLRAALARAEALLGRRIPIVSGLRTRAEQQRLWASRHTNPFPVAPPGTSLHERGLAVDVPLDVAGELARLWSQTGLCQPLPLADPVHFVLC